jgi:hypothetical protein
MDGTPCRSPHGQTDFEVPPHPAGNIGSVRGAPTPLRHRAHIELVLEFSGFKRPAQKIWHSQLSSANRLLSRSYFVRAGIFLLEISRRSNKIIRALALPLCSRKLNAIEEFFQTEEIDEPTEILADHSLARPRNVRPFA